MVIQLPYKIVEIGNCEQCPYFRDGNTRPDICMHPMSEKVTPSVAPPSNCPLQGGGELLKIRDSDWKITTKEKDNGDDAANP